jgi:hypothetical protein
MAGSSCRVPLRSLKLSAEGPLHSLHSLSFPAPRSLSRRADEHRHGSHRVELAPPLLFPTRQAATAAAACANVFANPFSLLCARLGRLARSRSAAALSRVAMAELRPPRDSLSPAFLHPNRPRHCVPRTTPPLQSSSPHRFHLRSGPPPERRPASRRLPWPHHHGPLRAEPRAPARVRRFPGARAALSRRRRWPHLAGAARPTSSLPASRGRRRGPPSVSLSVSL